MATTLRPFRSSGAEGTRNVARAERPPCRFEVKTPEARRSAASSRLALTAGAHYADAGPALMRWYRVAGKARWNDIHETRNDFPHADLVERFTVFNIKKYENEHVGMPHVSDAAMLGSLMEEKGVRQADVVRGTGISKTVLSLVLHGERNLTREHIMALSKYFEVNPVVFLGPA